MFIITQAGRRCFPAEYEYLTSPLAGVHLHSKRLQPGTPTSDGLISAYSGLESQSKQLLSEEIF